MLATPQKALFALANTQTASSDWVPLGGTFSGHRVTAYRSEDDTLTLSKDGTERRLKLKDDAKVVAARVELTGTVTLGAGQHLEVSRATLVFDQENTFPLKDGILCRITPTRRDDGTILYRASFERVLSENKRETISAPGVVARIGQQFAVRIDDLGFSFTPKPH